MKFNEGEFVVAIIHYNTPELTRACIGSLIYNGGVEDRLRIVVFDNSDSKPFDNTSGVTVIDNTQGQVIDFDAELAKFPERDRSIGCAKCCEFGSVKHMMTVQKLWELIPTGFVLMESDILITKPIAGFWRPEYSFVGYAQKAQPHNPFNIGRVLPMLCYMNVPLLTKHGARYYDPERTYGLLPGGRQNRNNWYDTGAVMLEDILAKRPHLKGLHEDIRPYVVHYGSASWQKNDEKAHLEWIEANRHLFPSVERCKEAIDRFYQHIEETRETRELCKVAVCAIGRLENRYAVEWVEHYNSLGVDKIYIYDNNRVEDGELLSDVLQPYIEAGFVEITPWMARQKQAYEDCYNRHNLEYSWIGFFDFDELVWIQEGRKVSDLLSGFDYADVLVMNWRTMTDNELLHYEAKPMRERFTEGTDEDFQMNRHVKSFVHTGIKGISFNDPHCPNAPKLTVVNVHGISVKQMPIQDQVIHDIARVDHYDTKTAEEWIDKNRRGWPDATKEIADRRKASAIEIFFAINKRTKEKEEILSVLKVKPEKVEIQNGGPAVVVPEENTGKVARVSKPKTKKSTIRKGK